MRLLDYEIIQITTTKGHVTFSDMINTYKRASGKCTFRGLSYTCNPADAISRTFCPLTFSLTLCLQPFVLNFFILNLISTILYPLPHILCLLSSNNEYNDNLNFSLFLELNLLITYATCYTMNYAKDCPCFSLKNKIQSFIMSLVMIIKEENRCRPMFMTY